MSDNCLTRAEATRRAELIRDVSYAVEVDLTDDGPEFTVDTTIRFTCAEDGAGTFVDFTGPLVEVIELNGSRLPDDAFDGNRIAVRASIGINTLVVRAHGAYSHTGVGLHRFVDPVDDQVYVHTQFEPFDAHRVFPCFDQPDLKARFRMAVLAPEGWVVASNGAARSEPRGSARWWTFAPLPPMSTYLVAIVAGRYHVVRDEHAGVPLGLFCRRSMAPYLESEDILEITRQGLDYFQSLFDYPYPFGKYDQLFVPEFNSGAMENAGCVTFNESHLFRSAVTEAMRQHRAGTILHEMAHMWFGDLVTMRWWDDLWLNESFATYMASRALVDATRFINEWVRFAGTVKGRAYRQDQLPTTHPISADIADTDLLRLHFDGITYAKGASVLRQLAAWVGQDAFDAGVRDYFRRHAFGNASLSDFLLALEKPSGRTLTDWSKEWLETAGVNTLRPVTARPGDRLSRLTVAQDALGEQPLRSHRVGIGLYAAGTGGTIDRLTRGEIDVVGEATDAPTWVDGTRPDLVLINDGDLAYVKIRFDARSLATLTDRLSDIADPLARSLCWAALWDMVRDAELPAGRFVAIVADHVHREPELATVQNLLANATTALHRYVDPSSRAGMRERLAELAGAQLDEVEPGSDEQVVWIKIWLSFTDDFARMASLLDGSWSLPGLTMDVDLRWVAISALCVRGGGGTDLVDAEARRDPTDFGLRQAAAIRAGIPDDAAKAKAWDALVIDAATPLATRRAVAGAFIQPDQDELLEPYVARYFHEVPGICEQLAREEAALLTRSLYPAHAIRADILSRAEKTLADASVGSIARRILIENADETRRAIRARAADSARR